MLADMPWDSESIKWIMIFAVPIVALLAGAWHKIERSRSENELKRSMVQRGMSAEEIERVIAARSRACTPDPGPTQPSQRRSL
jgi:hypothetical protein